MEIIIAIIIGVAIWVLLSKKHSGSTSNAQGAPYTYDIVGEASYQNNLIKIAGNKEEESKFYECSAKVISEPTNKYDKDAVKVEINGLTVGYLSRAEAQRLAGKRINKTVPAVINGGWSDGDSTGHFGVKLAINSVLDLV